MTQDSFLMSDAPMTLIVMERLVERMFVLGLTPAFISAFQPRPTTVGAETINLS
jgi:hypothetical protein